jgi:ABC-type nitrate/sulfonate/bicarbonate transport system substrate-binding protein
MSSTRSGRLWRSPAAVLAILLLIMSLAFPGIAAGYESPKILVSVRGPARTVPCGKTVTVTATVMSTSGAKPIGHQIVHWAIEQGSSKDSLSKAQSITNSSGTTSVSLSIGKADGNRKVSATAASIPGTITIKVHCDLPTPRPTPRATPRRTPRPTERPRKTPRPSATPSLERSSLRIGFREPDLSGRAPLLLAQRLGLFEQAGFDRVDLSEATDGISGLLNDSLDIAVVSLKDAADAITAGSPITILAGYHDYQADILAVGSDIQDVSQLAGKDIILGDPADADARQASLRDAGWDLEGAGATIVLPNGGPEAWTKALLAGDVALAPIQNSDRLAAERAGDQLVVDQQRYGDDVLVALRDLPATAPSTVRAFQTAYVAALQAMGQPAHDPDLYTAASAAGIDVTDAVKAGWANDLEDFRPWDGGAGTSSDGAGLAELQAYCQETQGNVPPLADVLAWSGLQAAQDAADLGHNPTFPELDAPADTELVVGVASGTLVDRAPLLLATARGAFARSGFDTVRLAETTDAIAGVQDGALDVAVVSAAQAADAVAGGAGIRIVAGYGSAEGQADGPSVLVVSDARASDDRATVAAFLQAYLRGLAALREPGALDMAAAAANETVSDESIADWAGVPGRYAPFDGSQGLAVPHAADVDLTSLDAASASLGMPSIQQGT